MEGDVRPMVLERGARRRRPHLALGAQATLEFAFTAPLFLLGLFAAVDAALWSVQTNAEVAGVEGAARVAASAGASPLSQRAPDTRAVTEGFTKHVGAALFGTRVVAWCDPSPGAPCAPLLTAQQTCNGPACRFLDCPASPQDVETVFGPRVVAVCVHEENPDPCAAGAAASTPSPYCGDSPMITVRVVGFLASLVPPGLGVGESGGELPTDQRATTHVLRFAT